MSRLRKVVETNANRLNRLIEAKPRPKKKEVHLTMKYNFECYEDNEDEAKAICRRFKHWMKDHFAQWDNCILQYFLYANNLVQSYDDLKYRLEGHIDKITRDDSATIDERNYFEMQLQHEEEQRLKEKAEEEGKNVEDIRKEDIHLDEPKEDDEGFMKMIDMRRKEK
jgi:hypothetical protein